MNIRKELRIDHEDYTDDELKSHMEDLLESKNLNFSFMLDCEKKISKYKSALNEFGFFSQLKTNSTIDINYFKSMRKKEDELRQLKRLIEENTQILEALKNKNNNQVNDAAIKFYEYKIEINFDKYLDIEDELEDNEYEIKFERIRSGEINVYWPF